jgi:hypothetical protein
MDAGLPTFKVSPSHAWTDTALYPLRILAFRKKFLQAANNQEDKQLSGAVLASMSLCFLICKMGPASNFPSKKR